MHTDILIIGAGAAGLMCAAVAGSRGRRVLVVDHNDQPGRKILASGGGRCNLTNRDMSAAHFLSGNPHFATSALARFTPDDILALLDRHRIGYREEDRGKLFCTGGARQVVSMLTEECRRNGVSLRLGCAVRTVDAKARFRVQTSDGDIEATALVVATGGASYRPLGASDIGYRIAKTFGFSIVPPRPALVPLLWGRADRARFSPLQGISLTAAVTCGGRTFCDGILLTHLGLSGPAILQASSFWTKGETLSIDLMPHGDARGILAHARREHPAAHLTTILARHLPRRFAESWCAAHAPSQPMRRYPPRELERIGALLHRWEVAPSDTAGWDKAEVTAGGVDTHDLSSSTMETKAVRGLFFIGEVVDVTGELGGYNLHWAWASGKAAGQALAEKKRVDVDLRQVEQIDLVP